MNKPRINTDEHGSISEEELSVTRPIIAAALEVANVLGAGFLEKVYRRALQRELELRGMKVRCEVEFPVIYKGCRVGDYAADIVVSDQVIVELKCAECFHPEHMAQCINYLRASGLKVALLLNYYRARLNGNGSSTEPGFLIRVHPWLTPLLPAGRRAWSPRPDPPAW